MTKDKTVYVCYRGENVEFIGTKYQVIEHYGWRGKNETLNWYTYPAARRRGLFFIEKVTVDD